MAGQTVSRFFSTIDLSWRQLATVMGVGFGVGALVWLLSLLMQVIFVEPVFCRSADSFQACANGGTISIVISTIIANIVGLIALVRLKVYRPLLVVIAAIITVFGLHSWTGGMAWYEATAWYAFVYALAYGLFAWLARMLSFAVTVILMIVIIVLLRVLMAIL